MSRSAHVLPVALGCLLLLAATGPAQTLTNGLVGYWPMDNTQLTELTDHTSVSNHGAFVLGSPTWVSGKLGNALDVYETTLDYATIPHHASYNSNDTYTLAFWLYPISTYRNTIITKGDVQLNHSAGGAYILLNKFGDPPPPAQFSLGVGTSAESWHHFVFVYDPPAGASAKRVYVDGSLMYFTNTVGAATDTALNTSSIEFSETGSRVCSARFDDLAIWDRALTTNEIDYLYNGGAGNIVADLNPLPTAPTNLVALPSDASVILSWATNIVDPDAYQYNVYRALSSPGPYTNLVASNLTETSCVDAGLVNGTPYYYVVHTVDFRGASSPDSQYASATPVGDVTPPAVPTGVAADGGYTRVYLSWAANSEPDLAGYNVYHSLSEGGPFVVTQALVSATNIVFNGISNGETHYYYVTSEDLAANESSASTTVDAAPAAFQDTNPGLVGYWPLDEMSGTNLIDQTDYTNHGHFAGGTPSWVTGKFANALHLSSNTFDYAVIPHIDVYTNATTFSVSFWMYSIEGYRKYGRFQKGSSLATRLDYSSGEVQWNTFGSAPWTVTSLGFFYNGSAWHHMVAVFDPSVTYAKQVWVDGALVVSNTAAAGTGDAALNADPIGFNGISSCIGATVRFDDVAFWDRPLTIDEIESIWNEGTGRTAFTPPPAGTVLIVR